MGLLVFLKFNGIEGTSNHAHAEQFGCDTDVLAFNHQVTKRIDPRNNAKIAGDRQHGEVTLTKFLDKATPELYKKLCTGDPIDKVEIVWLKPDKNGKPVIHFKHTFEDVIVTAVNPMLINVEASPGEAFQESVRFGYRKVTWECEGKYFTDEVRA